MGFLLISHGLPTVIAWASVFGFYSTVACKLDFWGGGVFLCFGFLDFIPPTIAARKDVFVGGWSLGFFFRVFETLVHRSPRMRLACGHWPCEGVKVDKKGRSR
jgi:hypothetical protein